MSNVLTDGRHTNGQAEQVITIGVLHFQCSVLINFFTAKFKSVGCDFSHSILHWEKEENEAN